MKELKPDTVIAGFSKCGTQSLLTYLHEHPEIYTPWDYSVDGNRGFNEYFKSLMRGDNSSYDFSGYEDEDVVVFKDENLPEGGEVIDYINKNFPDIKVIFMIRDPIKRAYSAYWYRVKNRGIKESFEEALGSPKRKEFILDEGRYKEAIELFSDFPEKNKFYIVSEEMWEDKDSVLEDLFDFLGVEQFEVGEEIHRNPSGAPRIRVLHDIVTNNYDLPIISKHFPEIFPVIRKGVNMFNLKDYPPMDEETKEKLIQYYKEKNRGLDEMIDKDLSRWWDWWE